MARPDAEAARLRRCREKFERSLRDHCSMAEADKRMSLERIQARAQRIASLRARPSAQPARKPFWYEAQDR
jgi:hypothetical protein